MARSNLIKRWEILERALDPFWRNGYTGTSLKQLEEATGLNPGSLYYHFSGKQDIFHQVLLHYIDQHLLVRLNNYRKGHPPIESLRLFFSTSYRGEDIKDYRCGCLLVMAMTEGQRELLNQPIQEAVARLEQGFSELLVQGRRPAEHGRLLLDRYIALQLCGHLLGSQKQRDRYVQGIFAALPEPKIESEAVQ